MNISLYTRTDVVNLFLNIIRPLRPFYSANHAFLHIGNTGVHYGEKSARMEGFARVLWGLGPLWSADNSNLPSKTQAELQTWLELYKEGILHGTNPKSPEYWGDIFDFDQKMVEAPAIAFTLLLNQKPLWDCLSAEEKGRVFDWLNQINAHDMPQNNWRWFRIMVNMAFRLMGLPWSEEKTEEDFRIIETSYIGDGWYFDGNPGQLDYYVAYAIHFYGMVYSHFMDQSEPERCRILRERSTLFFHDFVYWFANDGNELPFGRSLTYRYAHCNPFAAMAYAGLELDYGVLKNLILRNLETWVRRPIFDNAGVLTIGYGYPNPSMSENYNSSGSPLWSCKAFLILALGEDHPFWTCEAKPYPYEPKKFLKHPHMVITHDKHNHLLAYVTGQHCLGDHGQSSAKYEKFVYSNQFGFSIMRGVTLEGGAFDSTLAISRRGENRYCSRYGMDSYRADEHHLYTRYRPINGVTIESIVIPCSPWHVRIHRIVNTEAVDLADGGFALPQERCFQITKGVGTGKYSAADVKKTETELAADFPWGASIISSETGQEPELVTPFSNTNLFFNLTVIPTIRTSLEPGEHLMVTCAAASFYENAVTLTKRKPIVTIMSDTVQVTLTEENHTVLVDTRSGQVAAAEA